MDSPNPSYEALDADQRELLELLLSEAGVSLSPAGVSAGRFHPLSFAQRQLWFIEQLAPGQPLYNLPLALELKGALAPGVLARGLTVVSERHETLRTRFVERQGEPWAEVGRPARIRLPVVELGALAEGEAARLTSELSALEARRGFKLAEDLPWRACLLRLGGERHRLLLTLHHIVADDWAAGLLVEELGRLYVTLLAGGEVELEALPWQLADYVAWQNEPSQQTRLERQLAYWREVLTPLPPPLALPTDRPRGPRLGSAGEVHHSRLPPELSARVLAAVEEQRLTLFVLGLAAFEVLLARLSGAGRFAVGVPVANRPRRELEALIGFFANTVVLAADVDLSRTFGSHLEGVRRRGFAALAHQELPLARLVEVLNPPREGGQTPLFQVLFAAQNVPRGRLSLAGLEFLPVPLHSGTSPFELTFVVGQEGGEVVVTVEHAAELFDASTIERWRGHFAVLLDAVLEQPASRLADLALLTVAEREQLLWWWSGAARCGALPPGLLHQGFEDQVHQQPDRPAVIDRGGSVTYRDLDLRAAGLASRLLALELPREAVVAVLTAPGARLAEALLATLKAGGAFLPLDPTWPARRISEVVKDAGARIVLTDAEHLSLVSVDTATVLRLDLSAAPAAPLSGKASLRSRAPLGDPDALAYLFYTSGSTGRPRGVAVPHRAGATLARSMATRLALGRDDRMLQFAAPGFDVLIEELFPVWAAGGAVVFAPKDELSDPPTLTALLAGLEVTVAELPTPLWAEWCRFLLRSGARLPKLRQILVGCEKPKAADLERWAGLGVPLLHVFGLTETAVTNTTYALAAGEPLPDGLVEAPIGEPLTGSTLYCLSPEGQAQPPGVWGELAIGGEVLARGFLGQPGATAERFEPDPWSPVPGARRYRTGDLGRFRADGVLELAGRIDRQVKLRGHRLELGEVEAALTRRPEVLAAAAVVCSSSSGALEVVAFVVGAPGCEPDLSELSRALAEELPVAARPARLLPLLALPTTHHGKLDRARLVALAAAARAHPESPGPLPADRVEELLAAIWREILGREVVAVEENFFTLGGDSILVIQVCARARRAGLAVTPRLLFSHPTVRTLAAALQASPRVIAAAGDEAFAAVGTYPLSPIQRWFFALRSPNPCHFHQARRLRLAPGLELARLERALARVLSRHAVLRSRFDYQDGEPRAEVVAMAELAAPILKIAKIEPEAELEVLTAWLSSFDLERPPLLRGLLWGATGETPRELLWAAHHLVIDAVSWGVLLADLEEALGDELEATATPTATTTPFEIWSRRLEEAAASGFFAAENGFWRAQRPPSSAGSGAPGAGPAGWREQRRELGEPWALALQRLAPLAFGSGALSVLLTALLAANTDGDTGAGGVVFLEGHGREELLEGLDLTRSVGWFTCRFPLRFELGAAFSLDAHRVAAVARRLAAVPRGGVGWGLLEGGGTPGSAELSFNFLGQLDAGRPSNPWFEVVDGPLPNLLAAENGTGFRHDVQAAIEAGRLWLSWTYDPARDRAADIDARLERFEQALRELLTVARARAGQLALEGPPPAVEEEVAAGPLWRGLLFHSLTSPELGEYIDLVRLTPPCPFRPELFAAAWELLIRRHAALRATFDWCEGAEPAVRAAAAVEWHLAEEELADDEAGEQRVAALIERLVAEPFALDRAPLWRWHALHLGDGRYELLWAQHHLVADGWSKRLILAQLVAAYEALESGTLPPGFNTPLPPRSAGRLSRGSLDELRRQLAGAPAPTLPTALGLWPRGRSPRAYEVVHQALGQAEKSALELGARRQGLTVASLATAAMALLLGQQAGTEDVLFGLVVSGRSGAEPGLEDRVGLFINTLPLRLSWSRQQRVRDWLSALQRQVAALHELEAWSLEELRRELGWPADRAFFDAILVIEGEAEHASCAWPAHDLSSQRTGHALHLLVRIDRGVELVLTVAEVCPRGEAIRLLATYRQLLLALAESAEASLGELRGLSPNEAAELLRLGTGKVRNALHEPSFWQLFAASVEAYPEAVAASEGEVCWSYAALAHRAETWAAGLAAHGVGPEALVALLVERGVDFLSALLAVFRAGGAYLPLDLGDPPARRNRCLEAAAPCLVLAADDAEPDVASASPPQSDERRTLWLSLAELERKAPSPPAWVPPLVTADTLADSLAYVLYTSGSTGTPKGAMVISRGMVNHLWAKCEDLELAVNDRVAQSAPVSFDISVWQMLAPLVVGARLVILGDEIAKDPARLSRVLREQAITIVETVPSMLRPLLEEEAANAATQAPLRWHLVTGETLPVPLAAAWYRQYPRIPLLNAYGPTECSDDVTHGRVPTALSGRDRVAIGAPLRNTLLVVVDAWGILLPAGSPGELWVGGEGVGRGYRGDPRKTAEVFVPDAYGALPGRRAYRTGDRVRWSHDGELEFLGRLDQQVKVRGLRLELGEVEAAIRSHPEVAAAAARLWPDGQGGVRLVGYFVPERSVALSAGELRRFLTQHLPLGALPSRLLALSELPLNANGKLDRRALPEPEDAGGDQAVAPSPPRTELEALLVAIWAEVLGRRDFSVEEGFFDLGGHSLQLVQVRSRLEKQLGRDISVVALLEHPTVRALARHLAAPSAPEEGALPPLAMARQSRAATIREARQALGHRRGGHD